MDENIEALPDSLTEIPLGNRTIYLIGTAHVSKESVLDVQRVVEAVKPDSICIEPAGCPPAV